MIVVPLFMSVDGVILMNVVDNKWIMLNCFKYFIRPTLFLCDFRSLTLKIEHIDFFSFSMTFLRVLRVQWISNASICFQITRNNMDIKFYMK